MRNTAFAALADCDSTLWPIIRDVQYRDGGILPSEMLLFCCLCRHLGVTHVVESGRKNGYSLECLVRCGFAVTSIESHPLPDAEWRLKALGATLLVGPAGKLLPDAVPAATQWALLLDGPKGTVALDLAKRNTGYTCCGIHDMPRGKPQRDEMERRHPDAFFTDDSQFRDHYGFFDEDALDAADGWHDPIQHDFCALGVFR